MTIEPDKVSLVSEVAELLRCSKANGYALVARREIACTLVGAGKKGIRISGKDILAFLESRREGGPRPQGSFKYLKIRTGS